MNWSKSARWLAVALITLAWCGMAHAADPVVNAVSFEVKGNEHITTVEVTFTFSDADGDNCRLFIFGHDAATREYIPMVRFAEGKIFDREWTPGTHSVTWVASADASENRNWTDFVPYVRLSDTGRCHPGQYSIIDVSGGPDAMSYPVTYADYVDVRLYAYKTDYIVLRELPDGSYAGVFEITQRQYELVTGETPSYFPGNPIRPVEQVSWNDITDSGNYGAGFFKRLRDKAGLTTLDLPTSVCWETVCRAGTMGDFNDYTQGRGKGTSDESALVNLAWYSGNSSNQTHDAGAKQPNAWGLYDMHGNAWELCKDSYLGDSYRDLRGGGWSDFDYQCLSGYVFAGLPYARSYDFGGPGFRIFLPAVQ